MLNIAIYSQKKDTETFNYLKKLIQVLEEKKCQIFLYQSILEVFDFSKELKTFSGKSDLESQKVDYFFTLGGDGTILDALQLIQNLQIPVVGVNMGRLGFLANFNKDEIFDDLDKILQGEVNLSQRSVIEISTEKAEINFPYALNDVVLTRKETTSMITVEAEINGEFLSYFWGDGLIVATPSGSTAYSLSCGGAIIEPGNDNFSLTPIAPHNLNMRPIILKDDVEIKLKVSSREPQYSLGLDSRLYHIHTEDVLRLKKANFHLCLITPKNLNFYETLRQKLLWGKDKRN
ncbi:MAG: NAD kinase [Flavobacteriaceae bacterium]|nr:NAD kinase [Flavobacteriaceae bacterium]